MTGEYKALFKEFAEEETKHLKYVAGWDLVELTENSFFFEDLGEDIFEGILNEKLSQIITDKRKKVTIVIDCKQEDEPYYELVSKENGKLIITTLIVEENLIEIRYNGYIENLKWICDEIPSELKSEIEKMEEVFIEMLKSSNQMRLLDVTGMIQVYKKL